MKVTPALVSRITSIIFFAGCEGLRTDELAKMYGRSRANISGIINRRLVGHVYVPEAWIARAQRVQLSRARRRKQEVTQCVMRPDARPVPGLDGIFATPDGKIFASSSYGRKMLIEKKQHWHEKLGYYQFKLGRRNVYVHQCVCAAFWGERPDGVNGQVCSHRDDVRRNNVYTNLEWTSYRGNKKRARQNNKLAMYDRMTILEDHELSGVVVRIAEGETLKAISADIGCCVRTLRRILASERVTDKELLARARDQVSRRRRGVLKLTDNVRRSIMTALRDGETIDGVAEVHGLHPATVRRVRLQEQRKATINHD